MPQGGPNLIGREEKRRDLAEEAGRGCGTEWRWMGGGGDGGGGQRLEGLCLGLKMGGAKQRVRKMEKKN